MYFIFSLDKHLLVQKIYRLRINICFSSVVPKSEIVYFLTHNKSNVSFRQIFIPISLHHSKDSNFTSHSVLMFRVDFILASSHTVNCYLFLTTSTWSVALRHGFMLASSCIRTLIPLLLDLGGTFSYIYCNCVCLIANSMYQG